MSGPRDHAALAVVFALTVLFMLFYALAFGAPVEPERANRGGRPHEFPLSSMRDDLSARGWSSTSQIVSCGSGLVVEIDLTSSPRRQAWVVFVGQNDRLVAVRYQAPPGSVEADPDLIAFAVIGKDRRIDVRREAPYDPARHADPCLWIDSTESTP